MRTAGNEDHLRIGVVCPLMSEGFRLYWSLARLWRSRRIWGYSHLLEGRSCKKPSPSKPSPMWVCDMGPATNSFFIDCLGHPARSQLRSVSPSIEGRQSECWHPAPCPVMYRNWSIRVTTSHRRKNGNQVCDLVASWPPKIILKPPN